jgi:hypothetical protein
MLVEDGRGEGGGYREERFLHRVSRLLRRSEGEEEASAYFGRNDKCCGVLVNRNDKAVALAER